MQPMDKLSSAAGKVHTSSNHCVKPT
jgi:hypothetical protein